ncbi:hypothetical protein V6305_10865 [Serratia marcescens]|uniref:hypothetical protein n=1 Tax=Serratia TaxID=613 RepID=UPI00313B4B15
MFDFMPTSGDIHVEPFQRQIVNKTENVECFLDEVNIVEEHEIFYEVSNGTTILFKVESNTFQFVDPHQLPPLAALHADTVRHLAQELSDGLNRLPAWGDA